MLPDSISEAWTALDREMRWTGRGASVREVPDLAEEMIQVLDAEKSAARVLILAVHVASCPVWDKGIKPCGSGWLCERAKELESVGKENG